MDSTKGRASIDSQKRTSQDAGKRRPVSNSDEASSYPIAF